jgi:ribosomal protein S18 acetylase RimI-like enzyme
LAAVNATVAECEISQTRWNRAIAVAGGGEVWEDGELGWSWQAHDRQLMLNFPRSMAPAAVRRGIAFARERHARIVGAWLSKDTNPSQLEAAGFERGWEPWWMAAPLHSIPEPEDPRVAISADVPEYGPEGQRLLSLTNCGSPYAWHAVARVDARFAGRSWCIADGDVAGIYDMDVWPQFRRRGLGRALLRALCGSARAAGARRVVLNATPEGERLYSAEGFVRIGEGITYWHHLDERPDRERVGCSEQ